MSMEHKKRGETGMDVYREWIEGYHDRWYRKIFCCAKCGMKIWTESWDEKRCFGAGTILKDNSMPRYCPKCGAMLKTEKVTE